jgi:hypothetical protein
VRTDEVDLLSSSLVDVLDDTTRPRREADAEDRSDVRVGHGRQHASSKHFTVSSASAKNIRSSRSSNGTSPLPNLNATRRRDHSAVRLPASPVVVEARAGRAALAAELVHRPVDDGLGRVRVPSAACQRSRYSALALEA